MEGYCSTGQSPQRTIVPVEKKKVLAVELYTHEQLKRGDNLKNLTRLGG
jgi:hypothetical protein